MLFIGMLPDTNQSRDGTFSLLHSTSKQSVVYAVVTLLQGSTRSCRLYPLETGEEKRDTDCRQSQAYRFDQWWGPHVVCALEGRGLAAELRVVLEQLQQPGYASEWTQHSE